MLIFQVDAFTSNVFSGNPAAVCPLDSWLPDRILQQIAAENNLSETAFFVARPEGFFIRWFTPLTEVDLCGHATLASAHVLFEHLQYPGSTIPFDSSSGPLKVTKSGRQLTLDFPTDTLQPVKLTEQMRAAFNKPISQAFTGRSDFLLLFESEADIAALEPDFVTLKATGSRGVICTAPGEQVDFVSRFFAPGVGINEDPVTGSAHTTLTPFWAERLNKTTMQAKQISERGGELTCTLQGNRVLISGQAVTYLKGEINVGGIG